MSLDTHTIDTDANGADKLPPLLEDSMQGANATASPPDDEVVSTDRAEQIQTYLQEIESLLGERVFDESCHHLEEFANRLLTSMRAFLDLNENSLEAFQGIEKQMQSFLALHKQIYRYRDYELRKAVTRQAALKSASKLPR